MYNIVSGFNHYSGPAPTIGTILFFAKLHAWPSTVFENATPEIYAMLEDNHNMDMSSATGSNCLLIRLTVQFVALLTIDHSMNLHPKHRNSARSRKSKVSRNGE